MKSVCPLLSVKMIKFLDDLQFVSSIGTQTKGPDAVDPGVVAEEVRASVGARIVVIGIGKGTSYQ